MVAGASTLLSINYRKGKYAKFLALSLPFVIVATMSPLFLFLGGAFGDKTGYFLGFVFYWIFWCTIVPILLLGRQALRNFYRINRVQFLKFPVLNTSCVLLPLLLVYPYTIPRLWPGAGWLIITSSFVLAIVNGMMEEILWRGVFRILLPKDKTYIFYSSFGFAVWHFAPQAIFRNHAPGGVYSFAIASFILGLMYSLLVKNSSSLLPSSLSHVAFDFAGLGARIYF
jgi:membrane protease YdiL (CAAX protease family)